MRCHFGRKEQRREEAVTRAKEREAYISSLSQEQIAGLRVGMKEKVKHGVLSKSEALEQVATWSSVSPKLILWLNNYTSSGKINTSKKKKKKAKKNDKRRKNTS